MSGRDDDTTLGRGRHASLNSIGIVAVAVQAPQLPDAETLMKQVGAAYQSFTTLQVEEERTSERIGEGNPGHGPIKTTTLCAFARPGKWRVETSGQGMRLIDVSDGEMMWAYEPARKEYTITMAFALTADVLRANSPAGPKSTVIRKTLKEESIEIDGQKYDCWVAETRTDDISNRRPPSAVPVKMTDVVTTDWIDKRLLVRRQTATTMKVQIPDRPAFQTLQKTVYKNIRINEQLPDSMFTFIPPPDAREVKSIGMRPVPTDLVGKEAPDFHVKGLDETQYSLAAFKG